MSYKYLLCIYMLHSYFVKRNHVCTGMLNVTFLVVVVDLLLLCTYTVDTKYYYTFLTQ